MSSDHNIQAYLAALRAEGFDDQDMVTNPADTAAHCQDWRGLMQTSTPALLRPRSTPMVQTALRLANQMGIKICPQGGRTGLVLGSIPLTQNEVVMSLSRMNKIFRLDHTNATMQVGAGAVLDSIKQAADDAGLLFPLALGSSGTCQIGGNLSTNAGGINVIKYGPARSQCLGLEVVLADGSVVSNISGLRKDNRGLDLRQLFVGSEGTLGIITQAVLQLYPKPMAHLTFVAALDDAETAMALLASLKETVGDAVTSFELISRPAMEAVAAFSQTARVGFSTTPAFTVIAEIGLFAAWEAQQDAIQASLMSMLDRWPGLRDIVVAQSESERSNIWLLREQVVHCQKQAGPSIKHDISVPLDAIPVMVRRGTQVATSIVPGCIPAPFGHAGDGNLHFNITAPTGWSQDKFFAFYQPMNQAIHDLVHSLGGSFSAEHGIGSLKAAELPQRVPHETLATMKAIKQALDPKGTLNPGKVFALPPDSL